MFPEEDGYIDTLALQQQEQRPLADTLVFDYERGRFIMVDGSPKKDRTITAIKQWVELMLRTKRGKYRVYEESRFGTHLEDIIGQRQMPKGYLNSEMKREITEACSLCPYITRVDNFRYEREGGRLWVFFDLWTDTERTEVKSIVH